MEKDKNKKSEEIVRAIKLLESVLRSSRDETRRSRVKKSINKLRSKLKEMFPDANLRDLENAIYSNLMALPENDGKKIEKFEQLKDIPVEIISNYREDSEINEAAAIMNYFQERIWIVLSEQYIKLDFSNTTERNAIYIKLDESNKALKTFAQTIDDIERARSSDYMSQLNLIRVRHGRLFLYELNQFFTAAKKFINDLIASYESGGHMIQNPDDIINFEDYEEHKLYENWSVINTLKDMNEFIKEALEFINIPNIK